MTNAQLEACGKYCASPTFRFHRGLNRPRFTIREVAGRIDELHLNCDADTATLPWSDLVVWEIESRPAGCWLTVEGQAGTTFELVELATGEAPGAPAP